nr:MAG TPA: hypothetical protein [Caudoviricetes sp.]
MIIIRKPFQRATPYFEIFLAYFLGGAGFALGSMLKPKLGVRLQMWGGIETRRNKKGSAYAEPRKFGGASYYLFEPHYSRKWT